VKEEQEKMEQERMTLDEMRQIVQEADEVEFLDRQAEQRDWEREQRAKAPEVLALLRRHIPADRLPELEDFLSTRFGCDCLRDALWCEQAAGLLRERVPAEHWQEIEVYLDRGVGSGRVGAALSALESEEDWPF
jgi:hypothetical protein